MKKQPEVCDPCEQNFERKVDELVREGKTPTYAERMKKEREVRSAFADEHRAHTADKPEAKQPAKAGADKPAQ